MDFPKLKVIACVNGSNDKPRYLGFDSHSGGYPYWSTTLHGAHLFGLYPGDDELLAKEYDAIVNGPMSTMNDGTRYPNHMLHSALELSNKAPAGEGQIMILEVSFTPTKVTPVSGEIQKPRGFTY